MTKLRREKKLIPQEQKGMGDKGRRRFDTWSKAVSEMSPTPSTRPALIFKALSPADSTGPLPSSYSEQCQVGLDQILWCLPWISITTFVLLPDFSICDTRFNGRLHLKWGDLSLVELFSLRMIDHYCRHIGCSYNKTHASSRRPRN